MVNRKWLGILMSFLLLFSTIPIPALAADADFINISSSWKGSVFGDVGGKDKISSENFEITENSDGTVKLRSSNNRGKISSTSEGIAFYYQELPADANFEFTATATVESFDSNNQVSFGIMLRDKILINESSGETLGNYIAVGPIDAAKNPAKYTFLRNAGGQSKKGDLTNEPVPAAGNTYRLSLRKTGNIYVLTFGSEEPIVVDNFTFEGNTLYAGLYTSRNTTVVFSDIALTMLDSSEVIDLSLDTSKMKTSYLLDEALNLKGLKVTATYADGTKKTVSGNDYVVTGFDSSVPGTNTITINYGGISRTIDLEILPLTCTSLKVKYLPARTNYHPGDAFNPEGLTVMAEYNEGYRVTELAADKYTLSISGTEADGYVFNKPGTYTVEVISKEEPAVKTAFEVSVADADIEKLEIARQPLKTAYFIGEKLDLTGLRIYAHYNDGTKVRLGSSEYTVSNFDSSSAGEKSLTITHKGKTAVLKLTVKERSLTGMEITKYPKTTYYTGEEFNAEGLEVSKVYDNGDKEPIANYSLDTSEFNSSVPGIYNIKISADGLEPITLKVTVREKAEYEWKTIRFGQSTSKSKNYVNVLDDGTVEIVALEGGGKIATDHDGITFYYTEIDAKDNFVLSADIKVKEYAKNPHDGQESFGIMARDAIGTAGDSSVFASNIAAIGGFSGGTKNANGTQLFIRTGVTSPDGAGSQGIKRIMIKDEKPELNNTYPEAEYRLTLAKTNSGFVGRLNDGEEVIFFEPDILNVQNSKIYIGFYAARLATIEVSNIEFTVSNSETDAPKVVPPEEPVTPTVKILSLDKTSDEDYNLIVKANVNGSITVKQGAEVLVQDAEVKGNEEFTVNTVLEKNSDNPFTVIFLPDDTQNLSSYSKIISNFTVTMKTYNEDGDIYVSPEGTPDGDGTRVNPLDLDTAVAFVKPGQRIVLLDGVYKRSSALVISKYNDGTAENRKYMVAAPYSRPVIDFGKKSQGVVLSGNYWYIEGIDFARSAANYVGFNIGGNHNIVINCRFYENGDTGLQISRTDSSANDISKWPSFNKIINCESFDNRDPSENNADGFAAKLTCGIGNEFIGCVSHHNVDDGWDLYTKVGTGAIGAVVIDSCIAYENGTLTDGTVGKGDKNGFKLGGEGVAVPHVIKNCISFNNGATGFTSNSNPAVIAINNIAYNNAKGNLVFTTYTGIETSFVLDGFISYNTEGASKDSITGDLTSDENYLFNGTESVNKSGEKLSKDAFIEALLRQLTIIKSVK